MKNNRKVEEKKPNTWNLFYYMSKKSKDFDYSKSSLVLLLFQLHLVEKFKKLTFHTKSNQKK